MNLYTLKGFISWAQLANNAPGVVGAVGELSPLSQTFAPDHQIFKLNTDPAAGSTSELTVFKSSDQTGDVTANHIYTDVALNISNWILSQARAAVFANGDGPAFVTLLANQFADNITDVAAGPMIYDGFYWYPSWVSYTQLANVVGVDSNTVRLWYADSAFSTEYDEYVIRVVPPFDAIDEFFSSLGTVQTESAQFSVTNLMSRIQNVKANQPETYIRSFNYDYVYPNNTSVRVPTWWTVIEYGIAGDNLDAIKAAMVAYILANSTHSREEWAAILPDIFQVTEFILIPRWDQYAIPNKSFQAGIYSPTLNYNNVLSVAKLATAGIGYTPATIQAQLNIVPVQYKSLSMLAVGGPNNKPADATIQSLFSDYINVPSTSLDFNRMTVKTQQWLNLIDQMLAVAETMTEFSALPSEFMRLSRNGIMYLLATYDTIQYLMLPRISMTSLVASGEVGSVSGSGSGV